MKRLLIAVVGLLVIGAVVYRLFIWSSDEQKVRDRIRALGEAGSFSEGTNPVLYGAGMKSALREAFTPDAIIDAPELGGSALSVDAVAGGGVRLAASYKSATLVFPTLAVKVTGNTATATGRVILTATPHGGGGPRVEQRNVLFELARHDGDWRVTRMAVSQP